MKISSQIIMYGGNMKIARIGIYNKTQTVKDHLLNVANISKENAVKVNLKQTAFLAGLLHDMGKLSVEFQDYIKLKNNNEIENECPKVDHAVYGAKYIFNKSSSDGYEKVTAEIISTVICYHHGGLPDYIDSNFDVPIIKRMEKLNDYQYEKIFIEFEKLLPEYDFNIIFKESVKEVKQFLERINLTNKNSENKLFAYHMLIKTLYSILIDSDWYDSYLFESNNKYEYQDYISNYVDNYILNLQNRLSGFKNKKAKNALQQVVYDVRNKIADECLNFPSKKTGIYTLTVPTGGGKTLSSLNFALYHAKSYNKDRIFYIAPYTSIIEQNAKEIKKTIKCGEKLLEYHSNVISEENNNDGNEDETHVKVFSSRWNYPIVFTTMVQFLNTIFANPSQDIRKLQSLINSVIIFDEAQSVPLHCTSLFNEAVNFLSEFLNCTIVLCTATQPALSSVKRPLKLSNSSEIISDVKSAYEKLKRVEVIDKTINGGYSYEEAIEFLIKLKEKHKSILMVVNTVKTAEKLFNIINAMDFNCNLYYLSSNICPKHRLDIIESMKKSLNKNESVICISTQVIECGVDISFSTVIKSLSGLDSIAQASGRCNRHGEKEISNTYIINFSNEYENTQNILNIDIGKKQTVNILELYKNNPDKYNNNLLSTEIISEYFNRFIRDNTISDELDYVLKKEKTTIFKLLSSIDKKRVYQDINGNKFPLTFCYQFKTARNNFRVIEDNTKTIIVPYKKGLEIINDLLSSIDIKEKYNILKKVQPYTVNIFEHKFINLNKLEAFLACELEGVYLLKEDFYNKDIGIVLEKDMKILID